MRLSVVLMNKKILFFVTEDWFFCSHFMDRAVAAIKAGYEVGVVTRIRNHGEMIKNNGIALHSLDMNRGGVNPFVELKVLIKLIDRYRRESPCIVHNVGLKPIIYGSLAARFAGIKTVVNAPVGMGYIFSSDHIKARLAKPVVVLLYRYLMSLGDANVIVENHDDFRLFLEKRFISQDKIKIIRGAGVNLEIFSPNEEPHGDLVILLPARMLIDKGVCEFVEAAKMLKMEGLNARFILAGNTDTDNPGSLSEITLTNWVREGYVEWWGFCENMPDVLGKVHVVCLPSYREGLPKALIEAAACGRAIVATDVPGCREVVEHNINGLLVKPKDSADLAKALRILIKNEKLRKSMGLASRKKAVKEFSITRVSCETLLLYDRIVGCI